MKKNFGEFVRYFLCGIGTTIISIASFYLFDRVLQIPVLIANVLSWIFAVGFAYFSNRIWVFCSKSRGKQFIFELLRFYSGRLLTWGLEEVLLLVFVVWLGYNSMAIKCTALIVVSFSNYIVSKFLAFRKK